MVSLKLLFGKVRESGALGDLINILCPVGRSSFLLKSGEVMLVLQVEGKDAEGLDPVALAETTASIQRALKVFDAKFVGTVHTLKRYAPALHEVPITNPVDAEAVRNRHRFLNEKRTGLYQYETFVTVALRSSWTSSSLFERMGRYTTRRALTLQESYSARSQAKVLLAEIAESTKVLRRTAAAFLEQASDALKGRILPEAEALRFFRKVVNPMPVKATEVTLKATDALDFALADSLIECHAAHLTVDDYVVKTLTLKALPPKTHANILGGLMKIQGELRLVTEWNPVSPAKALAEIRSNRRHLHNTKTSLLSHAFSTERPSERELLYDESKEALVKDLGDAITRHETQGVGFGNASLTVTIYAPSLEEAEHVMAEAMRVVSACDCLLNEERYNGLNTYLSTLPGGHPYNLRKHLVTEENHADLALWFRPAEGEKESAFLGRPYLAAFETEDQTFYFYNLHVEDVGHTILFAPTGSGKSFFLAFILTHAQQYDPYTFIFDVGGSYRWVTELCGGSCISFGQQTLPFRINPFCLEPARDNLEFLYAFFKLLIESGDYRLTDSDGRELFEAIRAIYVLEPEQRRLLTLAGILPSHLAAHFRRWTEGEQYGHFFDNVQDTVSFARFQCIDFEGLDNLGAVREPLMFYLLHRVNDVVLDARLRTELKVVVIDETEALFRNTTIRNYVTRALRTWRKHNGSLFLSTQSLHDFPNAETMQPIIDNCPTKILLANPSLDGSAYGEVLKLTPTEQARIRSLIPKKQFLLKRAGFSKVLNLNVDSRSYWLFTTNPYEAKRREELVAQVGLSAALEILAGGSQ